MRKWMLAIVVICLLAGSVRADACPPQGSTAPNGFRDWTTILCRLQGRILGNLIRNGVVDEEVVRILGRGDKPAPTGGLVGGVCSG